jgi:HEAT repeat protein
MIGWLLTGMLLQSDAEIQQAMDAYKKSMKSTSAVERATAVAELGGLAHPRTASLIIPLLTSDLGPVRVAAAQALGRFDEQKDKTQKDKDRVATALKAALSPNAKEPGVVAAILGALSRLADPTAFPVFVRCLEDKDTGVAQAAVSGLAGLRSAASLEALIAHLQKLEKQLKTFSGGTTLSGAPGQPNRMPVGADEQLKKHVEAMIAAVGKSLTDLTGETFATSPDWQAWWVRARATFKFEK